MWLYGARTGDYCFSRTFPHSNDSGIMRRVLDEKGLESAGEGLDVAPVFEAPDRPRPDHLSDGFTGAREFSSTVENGTVNGELSPV